MKTDSTWRRIDGLKQMAADPSLEIFFLAYDLPDDELWS